MRMCKYRDLWQQLKELSDQGETILLYGMGNGADKILDVCEKKGITVTSVFASDGFARNNLYRGMTVTDFSKAKELYQDFTVLLSFASAREEVLSLIRNVAMERPLFVPDVPVVGETLFDADFVKEHEEELRKAYELFKDEESKNVFKTAVESKLTGRLPLFFEHISDMERDFHEILSPESYRITADLGAYTGDTAIELSKYGKNLQEILAVESDPKTVKRLEKNTKDLPFVRVYHGAAWKEDGTLSVSCGGNRGAGAFSTGKKTAEIPALTLDTLSENKKIDYIKYDVEGAEAEALEGSAKTISRDHPDLLVSLYHRSEDLFALPLLLKEKYPFYSFYIRRHKGVPTWDLNLYAVDENV